FSGCSLFGAVPLGPPPSWRALVITYASTSPALDYDDLSNGKPLFGGMIPITAQPILQETCG
ncbi:MAG: hypothetical protein M1600_01070, partial [Firmicutes bacterium]|nr:hypothetical protein [Bacillota bacterium]